MDDTVQHSVKPSSVRQTRTHPSSRVCISSLLPLMGVHFLIRCNQPLVVRKVNPKDVTSLHHCCVLNQVEKGLALVVVHYFPILTRRNSSGPVWNHSSTSSSRQPTRPRSSVGMSSLPFVLMESCQRLLYSLSKSYSSLSSASYWSLER